ncbi:GNAT family N-acetyltransferase [Paenibacillus jamilae]|uniref:GNAT family N-acetyltransferase n=1 Tax=Paenibacillus TaxID=44249 RepID=UPI0003D302F8|nr:MULTISPECIES: GNAT family N-acetyltransferase [Paenibacillus]AIW40093.1 acetyltransferase [Paenibacillus polymyxa CR1]
MNAKIVMTEEELKAAYQIRKAVFVEEQGISHEEEFDAYDQEAEHMVIWDQGQPVGASRWRIVDGIAKFERICVLASHRKHGVGKMILTFLEQHALNKGLNQAKLHGQTQAEPFYHKLGYQTASEVFIEDGLPHVLLVKQL